ncbi:twin-arginine translocation signal domain-containing protein [Sulfurimonas sp. CS5]|uniref:twin-arginine translocation signal domain-containing protein n=1 Tax=Sulfurimonas sp. CS5 TaxID=3391145 RepID=UPI0039EB76CB
MQESRRNFFKRSALVVGAAAVSATALAANKDKAIEADSNGVVVGTSTKKEILYTKTKAWEDFYKQAL